MKFKFIIIISLALIVSLVLGGFIMSVLFMSDRKHYKIYEKNGEYYYRNYWNRLSGAVNEKIPIVFEDDLALIREYKVEGSSISTINIWKYIDKKGNVVLHPDVYIADAFCDGLAAVMPDEGTYWGYIDKKGEMVIEPQYRRASMFKDGFASVYTENYGGKWILINKSGEYIHDLDEPLSWKSYTQANPKNN